MTTLRRVIQRNVYRENEAEITNLVSLEKGEYINGGKLERYISDEHLCHVPGFWSRLWNRIRFGDAWTCTCGMKWVWHDYHDTCVTGIANMWVAQNGRQRR